MTKEERNSIKEYIVKIMHEQDSFGINVRSDIKKNYENLILYELNTLENLSNVRKDELRIISKFIRNNLWIKHNEGDLYNLLHRINQVMNIFANIIGDENYWTLDTVVEYAEIICKHSKCHIEDRKVYKLYDDIQMVYPKKIIESQWEDILKSKDGMKPFKEIFDDFFENAINKYPDKFIKSLSKDIVLCRMVKEKSCNEERFVPWPNITQNRWNPPGKTFLYMSYSEEEHAYDTELTLEERVCLLECRTLPNTDCCFCKFEPTNNGRIIDLSYNDSELYEHRSIIDNYGESLVKSILPELLSDKQVIKNKHDESFVKEKIRDKIETKTKNRMDVVITESLARQYLQMICNCIYKKVDGSEDEKEQAYHSFHILAEYLISKGITGIIYPCTRDLKIKGKNIVLFNIDDAKPRIGTIKQYRYIVD